MLNLDENKLEKYREEILNEFVRRPDIVPEFNRFFNVRIKKILTGNS
jgi:hypothetical protein